MAQQQTILRLREEAVPFGCDGIFLVDSQPGDATRYQFMIYCDGPDEYTIMPTRSTFKFPQRINWWDVKEITVDEAFEACKENRVNPHTLMEVVRIIKMIRRGKGQEV